MTTYRQYTLNITLVILGYLLSPLSWWNDLVVNVPLAYLFSIPFTFINEKLFVPSFIIGYWLTNLFGFLLLHWGSQNIINKNETAINFKNCLFISIIYSTIIIILVLGGWLSPPSVYLKKLQ